MNCPHCNAVLDMFKGNTKIKGCPFCLNPLDVDLFLDTALEKLSYFVEKEGKAIFAKSNQDKLFSYVDSWPESLSDDRDLLRVLAIKQIPEALFKASELDSTEAQVGIVNECLDILCEKLHVTDSYAVKTLELIAKPLQISVEYHAKENENEFVDPADGNVYKTTVIGDQVWMAENYRRLVPDAYAPNYDLSLIQKYGVLYTWNSAVKFAPKGWHLPDRNEWETMLRYVDNGSLKNSAKLLRKSEKNWKGTDNFSFSALPAGYREKNKIEGFGSCAAFWTFSRYVSFFCNFDSEEFKPSDDDKLNAYSVRYVKNK